MEDETKTLIFGLLGVIFIAAMIGWYCIQKSECEQKGGILMREIIGGAVCVKGVIVK